MKLELRETFDTKAQIEQFIPVLLEFDAVLFNHPDHRMS